MIQSLVHHLRVKVKVRVRVGLVGRYLKVIDWIRVKIRQKEACLPVKPSPSPKAKAKTNSKTNSHPRMCVSL